MNISKIPAKNYKFYSIGILAVLIVAIYAKSISYPFQFDDNPFIVNNKAIQHGSPVNQTIEKHTLRAVPFLSFTLNYHLKGLNPEGYRLINIVIHFLNSVLVFFLIQYLFKTPVLREKYNTNFIRYLSLAVALIFAVHPLQTQAVVYIYQRLASLAALFYFSSAILFIAFKLSDNNKKRIKLLVLLIISIFLGVFSKENFFTLPATLYVIHLLFFKNNLKINPLFISVFLLITAALIYYVLQSEVLFRLGYTGYYYTGELITPVKYLMTQFSVLLKYMAMIFVPAGQNIDHQFPLFTDFWDLKVIAPLMVHILIIFYAIFIAKKERIVTFGILWFYITIFVESSIIPIHDLIFEHRIYLPLTGFVLAIIASVKYFFKNLYRPLITVSFLYIFIFAGLSILRLDDWKTQESLWKDAANKSPDKFRPFNNLGYLAKKQKNYNKALRHYSTAIQNLQPTISKLKKDSADPIHLNNFTKAYKNRGLAYYKLNEHQKAVDDFTKYIKFNFTDKTVFIDRANSFKQMGKYEKALTDYNKFLKSVPEKFKFLDIIYFNKGFCYIKQEEYQKSIKVLNKAIALNDQKPQYYDFRAFSHFQSGNLQKAKKDYIKLLELKPSNQIAKKNIKIINQKLNIE